MSDLVIEQAIYGSAGADGYHFLATSAGFGDEWRTEAQRLCTAFGERPVGVACPACLFVQPFGPKHVVVVQAADQGRDAAGRPGTLRFRLLVVPRSLYADIDGDPFLLADAFPPEWGAKTPLPALTVASPPKRTVEMLQQVLNVPHSATLLGAAQSLIDGARVVFARSEPDAAILRSLWALLPSSSRCELWPATFAFGNVAAFHAVAVPPALTPTGPQWIHEEQAGDYPEGRYELSLQVAVESGNQRDLDDLLARKTRGQMIKIAAAMLAALLGIVLVPLAMYLLRNDVPPASTAPPPQKVAPAALDLPPENACPKLKDDERTDLAAQLQEVGKRLHIEDLPGGGSDEELTKTLAALDAKLGVPDVKRERKPLAEYGAIQRQVRALLWTHDVPDYNNLQQRTDDLIKKLGDHLDKKQ